MGSAHGSIVLDADLSGIRAAVKALADFQKQSAETSKAIRADFDAISRSLAATGAKMSLAVTTPLTLAAKVAIDAASDQVEAQSAVNTIFAEGAQIVLTFATTSAQALGISRAATLNAAVGFAGMGKAAGLAGQDLADFSTQLVTNAADLASFFNQDPGDMLDRLRSGLAGEVEPLRQFGIDLSQTNVQAKALELGLGGVNGELTQQEKVLARYAIIQDSLGAAMGDRARTANQFAGSLRTLQAAVVDLAASFGQELLPFALKGIAVLTDLAEKFGALPSPVKQAILVLAGIAAIAGPILVTTAALVALAGAAVAAAPLLAGLAAAALPLAAVIVGGTAVAVLAKHIYDTGQAADEAKDPVDSLTESIAKLNDEAGGTAVKFQADSAIKEWQSLTAAIDATAQAKQDAERQLGEQEIIAAQAPNQGVADAAEKRIKDLALELDAIGKITLSDQQRADIEQDINTILGQQGELRAKNLAELNRLLALYTDEQSVIQNATKLWKEGAITTEQYREIQNSLGLSSEGLTNRIDELTRSQGNLAGTTGNVNAELTETERHFDGIWSAIANDRMSEPWNSASNAVLGYSENTAEAEKQTREAREEADAFFASAKRQAAALASDRRAATMPGFAGMNIGEQTPAQAQANADALASIDERRTQQNADAAARRTELEQQYADDVQRINRDLQDTLRDLNDQRAQNDRDMHRSLVEMERNTAQQMRQLQGQASQAIADATGQLADIAEQRTKNALDLQRGLSDAQEAANDQFADLAEQRVEIQADAAKRMVDAEEAATEALADLAKRRRDAERDAAESIADSREQASDALADLAEREADIQSTLAQSLTDAQQQYNDALHDLADQQAEVRQNLQQQLSDLSEAWQQQSKDLRAREAEIRGDLKSSLREMKAGWASINTENLSQQRTLRGAMQDTLAQNTLTAQQMRDDLARLQGDPTFTAEEKDDAAFRTARALEALALDRQLAEQKGEREIASLEDERRKQQQEYEAERATAVEQAKRDLQDLNRQRMEAEKQYHDQRIKLEEDAAARIADLNQQRKDAAQKLAAAEAAANRTANDGLADLAKQRIRITEDAAEREHDIRRDAAEQNRDIAAQMLEVEQNLAEKRQDIQEDLADRQADLAKQEADVAEGLARQQQGLRDQAAEREQDLATRAQTIHEDLAKRLADIEHQKAIVVRDEARQREVILREHANNAWRIAKDQADAENQAVKDGQDARRTLMDTIADEDLLTAGQRGKDQGEAFVDAEIAGILSKKPEVQAAIAGLTESAAKSAVSLVVMKILGQNLGNALVNGLNAVKTKVEDAGKAIAGAAEKGAKKEAEIKSPSRRWRELGVNMGTALADGQRSTIAANEAAARENARRAAKAAGDELKRTTRTLAAADAAGNQQRRQQQREIAMARGDRSGGSPQPIVIHLTTEMDGQVIERKVIDVTANGMRGALHRNPLTRRGR